jgi:hypothetical protein
MEDLPLEEYITAQKDALCFDQSLQKDIRDKYELFLHGVQISPTTMGYPAWTSHSGNCFFDSLCRSPYIPCENEHDCRSLIGITLHEQPVLLRLAEIACLVWNDEMGGDNMPESDLNDARVATIQKESLKRFLEEYLKDYKYVGIQMEIIACIAFNIEIVVLSPGGERYVVCDNIRSALELYSGSPLYQWLLAHRGKQLEWLDKRSDRVVFLHCHVWGEPMCVDANNLNQQRQKSLHYVYIRTLCPSSETLQYLENMKTKPEITIMITKYLTTLTSSTPLNIIYFF